MPTVYLFQIDGDRKNDTFFEAMKPDASRCYKGVRFQVGDVPWIPDLVQLEIHESDESPLQCVLTLIELEEEKPQALISCRKYLPEDSNVILRTLNEYLDRIIRDCKSRADTTREERFTRLRKVLEQVPIIVKTACALRSSTNIIEVLPLIDQAELAQSPGLQQNRAQGEAKEGKPEPLQGTQRFNGERAKALGRCVLVLDAVIRREDRSGAKFKSWRNKDAPLKRLLKIRKNQHPLLRKLVLEERNSGIELNFDALLLELVAIWPGLELEDVRRLIGDYLPTASEVKQDEKMQRVFQEAQKHVSACVPTGHA